MTKYFGPTDHRGSRIIARAGAESGPSLTVPWDHALNVDDNHTAAARALAAKLEWHGAWACGWFDGRAVFVCLQTGMSLKGGPGFEI